MVLFVVPARGLVENVYNNYKVTPHTHCTPTQSAAESSRGGYLKIEEFTRWRSKPAAEMPSQSRGGVKNCSNNLSRKLNLASPGTLSIMVNALTTATKVPSISLRKQHISQNRHVELCEIAFSPGALAPKLPRIDSQLTYFCQVFV